MCSNNFIIFVATGWRNLSLPTTSAFSLHNFPAYCRLSKHAAYCQVNIYYITICVKGTALPRVPLFLLRFLLLQSLVFLLFVFLFVIFCYFLLVTFPFPRVSRTRAYIFFVWRHLFISVALFDFFVFLYYFFICHGPLLRFLFVLLILLFSLFFTILRTFCLVFVQCYILFNSVFVVFNFIPSQFYAYSIFIVSIYFYSLFSFSPSVVF